MVNTTVKTIKMKNIINGLYSSSYLNKANQVTVYYGLIVPGVQSGAGEGPHGAS